VHAAILALKTAIEGQLRDQAAPAGGARRACLASHPVGCIGGRGGAVSYTWSRWRGVCEPPGGGAPGGVAHQISALSPVAGAAIPCGAGKTPGGQAVQDALGVLGGKALFEGEEHPVCTRLAEHDGAIYLDLADPEWQVVKVTAHGWEVITEAPVKFRRARGMMPLVAPVHGGKLEPLRKLINVSGADDWRLLVAWLVAALRPVGPYPVLVLHREQGSAKSTTARMLCALIDPSTAALRAEPRDARDLMIAGTNGWVLHWTTSAASNPGFPMRSVGWRLAADSPRASSTATARR
jgi:hypothetical protein